MVFTKEKVEEVIKEQIRPELQKDGGDITLVDIDTKNKVIKVLFKGACVGCPMRNITLSAGIETKLKDRFPELKKVEVVE